jgi:hypothetical protein
MVPVWILSFVLVAQVLIDRYYARWSRRMKDLDRRDAEMVESLKRQREARAVA